MTFTSDKSLMVVLDREEYCFLYDDQSVPELLECILDERTPPDVTPEGFLHLDHALEIARGVLGRLYRTL